MNDEATCKRILITGSAGQLGFELQRRCPEGIEGVGGVFPEVDITDVGQVEALLRDIRPGVLINAAAYTAVDKAESDEATATAVNVDGPENLALAAGPAGVRIIHVSTDFVFDGKAGRPYREDDPAAPLGVYGKTKLQGERAVLQGSPGAVIIRTSWLYSCHGNNFVKTMLRLMAEKPLLKVVNDQVGSPTWAAGLADALLAIARNPVARGVYHWSDSGSISWYQFAVAIREEALELGILDQPAEVLPVPGTEFPTPAKRPAYSVLDTSRIRRELGLSPAPWRENLRKMLREIL